MSKLKGFVELINRSTLCIENLEKLENIIERNHIDTIVNRVEHKKSLNRLMQQIGQHFDRVSKIVQSDIK
ncbi:hypothetical protein [Halalkalibacter alkalisediminis]|uniref:Uncharacterized protein n=1 Tax=Halalkalibacter alkalisediminis TaxID=935616 RepID=A0ABV6NMJ2_9BACI|nr:hypothetical protein [Halalkalibacter alkalisediminis]